ncbi:MAG: NAD-dependent epimerase/dehydratase family protein [Pyrinomonadaceae bacterium]
MDRLIAESNWRVTVVDDFNDFYSPEIKRANVQTHLAGERYRLVEIDIRDRSALQRLFRERPFDVIVHLAARAGVRPSLADPLLYNETNITGTLNLLDLARESGTRQFVFGSSSSVYGINAKVPFSEDDPIAQPISPYAATKAAGELLCHTYSHLYGIRCVCLRFFTVYGARQRPDLAIHKFARLISEGRAIPVFGDGTTRRDYTYVDDIISGVRAAMNRQAPAMDRRIAHRGVARIDRAARSGPQTSRPDRALADAARRCASNVRRCLQSAPPSQLRSANRNRRRHPPLSGLVRACAPA